MCACECGQNHNETEQQKWITNKNKQIEKS